MKRIFPKLKNLGSKLLNNIPHFRSYNRIRLIGHVGDLCLIRSELYNKYDELTNEINQLSSKYSIVAITKDIDSIEKLSLSANRISKIRNEVSMLLKKNLKATNKVEKLDKFEYINDKEVEQSIINLIKKSNNLIDEFDLYSEKISSLNLIETP